MFSLIGLPIAGKFVYTNSTYGETLYYVFHVHYHFKLIHYIGVKFNFSNLFSLFLQFFL